MKRINIPTLSTSFVLAFAFAFAWAPTATSQPTSGSCVNGGALGTFDGNRVQATVFTVGSMFFGPAGFFGLNVDESSAVFASSVWLGGRVNGQLRIAATTYGQGNASAADFEWWPGPLTDQGQLPNPNDCSQYDRIWKVSRQDIADYNAGNAPATDLAEWPADLGAPVIDGDGNPDNYNLEGGDRPDIIGDQALWWVMNDVGNTKNSTLTPPIGAELRMHMFGFERDNPLGTTTFYKATLINKWNETLEDARVTVFVDPDLGSATDDYVGSDTTLKMGFVYNADNNDAGGYGLTPPALGYDFFQGPLVEAPGERWEDPCYDPDLSDAQNQANGCLHLDQRRLGMTVFNYFNNENTAQGNPGNGTHYWNYMNGLWRDGDPFVACGTGFGCSGETTNFAYPGDPVTGAFWSEENNDGAGTKNTAADRRFMVTTGPFDMDPGETQEIVFGIVYARGVNRLSSVTALRAADIFAQNAFDLDFNLPIPAPAPPACDANNPNRLPGSGHCFQASELDGAFNLTWGYAPTDPGYLGNYESEGYQFEGFNVYEYPNSNFSTSERELRATYDKANGITTVHNFVFDPQVGAIVPILAAHGADSGLNYSLNVTSSAFGPLSNYSDYFFGVSTYLVDETQEQERVVESAPTTITVRPASIRNADGGTTLAAEYGDPIEVDGSRAFGDADISATIVDPSALTGETYRIRWYNHTMTNPDTTVLTYNIESSSGEVLFDGSDYAEANGGARLEGSNIITLEGITYSLSVPAAGFSSFAVVANASGPIEPHPGAPDFNNHHYPTPGGGDPVAGVQQANSDDVWLIVPGPVIMTQPDGGLFFSACGQSSSGCGYQGFLQDVVREGVVPYDWEIRFVEDPGSLGDNAAILVPGASLLSVPFELWRIGIGTPDDPSDDVRYFPLIFDYDNTSPTGANEWNMLNDEGFLGGWLGGNFSSADHGISGGTNDPMSDQFTWLAPSDPSATGEEGFQAWLTAFQADYQAALTQAIEDVPWAFGDMALAGWNMGDTGENPAPWEFNAPEPGTVFRMTTFKPLQQGDVFTINTAPYAASTGEGLTQEDVDRIGIVPNPYLGFSAYESANAERVARFTNLPERATIRIFTISGTLIRTLEKDSPARSFDWNLQTEGGLPVASGLYLIHIELPESGLERVIKFGVVNRQTQLPIL